MSAAATFPAAFVHIGDAHMAPGERNDDRWSVIEAIVEANRQRTDLAGWLVPGDLNDARMSIDDRNRWASLLIVMGDVAPVFICRGNHDLYGDLNVFGKLWSRWPIYVITEEPQVFRAALPVGGHVTLFALPYPTEAGLVARGVAPGQIVSTARDCLDVIFVDAAAPLEAARAAGDITMMIGHVNVAGSVTSAGQPNIGQEIELDPALLSRLGPCYKGLNHIHRAQDIGGAVYPGSICRLDWGEIEPKGYVVVTHVDPLAYTVTTVPIDVAPMYHVEGLITRESLEYHVAHGDVPRDASGLPTWKGCEVRARLKFAKSERNFLQFMKARVLAEFADAKRLKLELIAENETALRSLAVASARTIPEKMAAWATEIGTVVVDDVVTVLPALEHGDHELLIAAERAAVDALVNGHAPAPAALVDDERQVAVA